MRKSVCVLLCGLVSVFSSHIWAQKVIAQSGTEIPVAAIDEGVTGDLLHPDFAYPQDVIKTAEAFLKTNPSNDPNTVLALSEIVTARNSIDNKEKAPNVQLIFDLAEKVTDNATRSMLWLYGSQVCEYYGRQRSWWSDDIKVRGTDVSKWEADDYAAAGDSLYMLALENAPADVPLSKFADALDATPQAYSFLPSVRDFVLYLGLQYYKEKVRDKIVKGTPLWYYNEACDIYDKEYYARFQNLKKFLERVLGEPDSEYAVYVFAREGYGNRSAISEGEFINKLAETYRHTWVSPAVDALLDYCNQPNWILTMSGSSLPGDTLTFRLVSTKTDKVEVNLERYDQFIRGKVTDATPNNKRKLVFEPRSGYIQDTTFVTVVNVPGNYYVDNKFVYSSSPWYIGSISDTEKVTLMALDSRSGSPVKGIEIIYTVRHSGNKVTEEKVITDKNGLAVIGRSQDTSLITIKESSDPKTNLSFNINRYLYHRFEARNVDEDDDDDLNLQVTFDRPVYRPGDVVKWVAVATDSRQRPAKKVNCDVEINIPTVGGELKVDSTFTLSTVDSFGRFEGKYRIPANAAIGEACFETDLGSFYFSISDFKLPNLNLSEVETKIQGDSVAISGRVTNSSDAGRSGISVQLSVNYGDSILVETVSSSNNGDFALTVPRTVKPIDFKYRSTPLGRCIVDYRGSAYVDIVATSPDGQRAEGTTSFEMLLSSSVSVMVPNQINSLEGGECVIDIINYVPVNNADTLDIRWAVTTPDSTIVLSGNARPGKLVLTPSILAKLKNGKYILWAVSDNEPSRYATKSFVCYNTRQTTLPITTDKLWIPTGAKFDCKTGKAEIEIGVAEDNTYVWWGWPKGNAININGKKLSKGFTKIELIVPETYRDNESVSLNFWTVKSGQWESDSYTLLRKGDKEDVFTLSLESFRDRLVPESTENWRFVTRIGEKNVSAAVYANLYNNQLNKFGNVTLPYFNNKSKRFEIGGLYLQNPISIINQTRIANKYSESTLLFPSLLYLDWKYGINRYGASSRVYKALSGSVPGMAVSEETLYESDVVTAGASANSVMIRGVGSINQSASPLYIVDGMPCDESLSSISSDDIESVKVLQDAASTALYGARGANGVVVITTKNGVPKISPDAFKLRTDNVLNALWAPMLTTDSSTGTVDVEFTVPNQSSTWVLKASAWTADLQYAVFSHTFTAVKPVIVAPNPPRFVRVGDTVNLVTAITNTTDSVADIRYTVNVGGTDIGGTVRLDGGATRYVTTPVSITGDVALLDSLALTVRATNGVFGDGERVAVPVLPSSALVVESRNFYLNPTDAKYTAEIPSGDDSESELHFTANPMWVVVESLPSVLDEPCFEVSTAYAQSLYVAKTALKIAEGHPAARPTIDVAAATQAQKTALDKLGALQTKDGGLRWGQWQTEASLSATLNFLGWMDQDTDDADIKKIVGKALEYVDNHIDGRTGATNRPDLYYSYVRSAYGTPTTLAGRQVVDATLNHVRKNWRGFGLSDKAMAVTLLYRTGNKALAKTILSSISQFGKITADRGMVFPNMPGIVGYANLLEAYGLVLPDAPETDAIRQGLIAQRRGASWGKSAHTSYAVRAMVNTGTDWTVPAEPFTVNVDGRTVDIASENKLTGAVSMDVKGKEVTIERTGGVPAYGAVVTRRVAPLSDIAAFSDGEVTIEKNLYRKDRAGNYVLLTDDLPKPGEKVTVRLTLTAKADMTDLIVTDLRPAAFEPVDQTGRYSHSGTGLWFYLANRDTQTEIYIDRLPRGRHIVEYEVTVNNTGTYTTGMATITSGIDPDLTAHSASAPLSLPE